MQIFLDADAMPRTVREILFRAAERNRIQLVLVANQELHYPGSGFISNIVVPAGPDTADDKIVELVREGDLVISADIPLADRVLSKKGHCIDPRGNLFTPENIKERLAVRDLMSELRDSGIPTPGPSAYSPRDRQNFANQLDRFLAKNINKNGEC